MPRRPVPQPGRAVRGSTTGRPVVAAMDLLGRRWALRILWELREGDTGPRALLDRIDGLSSSVLYDRLRELGEARLVEHGDDGYRLTTIGRRLGDAISPLSEWSDQWAAVLREP